MHKVILHISSPEEKSHQGIFNQINNILQELPETTIEVATHSGATPIIFAGVHDENIARYEGTKVKFLACENSLRSHNKSAGDLASGVEVVPSTLAHIIRRQAEGWMYIKIG